MDNEQLGELGLGDLSNIGALQQWPIARLFSVAARLSGPVWLRLAERQPSVSPTGFFLLRVLVVKDGLRAGEVARHVMTSPATVTSVVDTLERDGYLQRHRDDADRRAVRLHITDTGRDLVAAQGRAMGGDLATLYAIDAADEPAVRRFLLAVIDRFDTFLKEERPEGRTALKGERP